MQPRTVVAAAAVLLASGLLAGAASSRAPEPARATAPTGAAVPAESAASAGSAVPVPAVPGVQTGAARDEIEAARNQVKRLPGNWPAWSALGELELERGRATGDPAAYAAAQEAFDTSLRLQPQDNDLALAGRAALSAARHDFAGAEREARQALAVNDESPAALAALTDALTELGRYDEALATATRLDGIRPGVASFTRLSYQAELRGRSAAAIELMTRAAAEAATPAQVAFARSIEGQLRLGTGDLPGAEAAYAAGTAVAADDAGLALLGARLAWAGGDRELAVRRYSDLVARRPTPANAAALAEVLGTLGRTGEADAALDLARAGQLLSRQAGIAPEAGDVLFEADHGDPAKAVTLAAEVWRRSPSVGVADAYAWALHAAGRDREALTYTDTALALGGRPAAVLAHRGTIRAALGDRAGAIADLRAALAADPAFSPLHGARAQTLLHQLEARS